jgi:hypothetical protein
MSGQQLDLSELKRVWIDDAAKTLDHTLLARGNEITVEDVRRLVLEPPHTNWYGCLMARLKNSSRIREIGRVRSSRPEANGRKISLWEVV